MARVAGTSAQQPSAPTPACSLPSWAWAAHSCTMGRLLGVGERKERSEGSGTGLPWDEAEGPIPLATKLPKKASPAERSWEDRQAASQASTAAPAHHPETPASPQLCGADAGQLTKEGSPAPAPPLGRRMGLRQPNQTQGLRKHRTAGSPQQQTLSPRHPAPSEEGLLPLPPNQPRSGLAPFSPSAGGILKSVGHWEFQRPRGKTVGDSQAGGSYAELCRPRGHPPSSQRMTSHGSPSQPRVPI